MWACDLVTESFQNSKHTHTQIKGSVLFINSPKIPPKNPHIQSLIHTGIKITVKTASREQKMNSVHTHNAKCKGCFTLIQYQHG